MNNRILSIAAVTLMLGACGGGSDNGSGSSVVPGNTGESAAILGAWGTFSSGPGTFITFFEDGTYVHVHEPESIGDKKGLEWGNYSRNGSSGKLSAVTLFDENEGAGPGAVGTDVFAEPSGNNLAFTFVDQNGSTTETLLPIGSDGIEGSWRSTDSTTQLNMLSFHSNNTYIHAQVDTDIASATSGAEKGTYTLDGTTGEISVNTVFDLNGSAGLANYASPAKLFAQVADNTLTLTVDVDGDGITDESHVYLRE